MDELCEGRTFPEDDLQLVKSIIARHSKCWVEGYALMVKVVPETDSEEVFPLDQIVRTRGHGRTHDRPTGDSADCY